MGGRGSVEPGEVLRTLRAFGKEIDEERFWVTFQARGRPGAPPPLRGRSRGGGGGGDGVFFGLRVNNGVSPHATPKETTDMSGLFLSLRGNGSWALTANLAAMGATRAKPALADPARVLGAGAIGGVLDTGHWYELEMAVAGSVLTASVGGVNLFRDLPGGIFALPEAWDGHVVPSVGQVAIGLVDFGYASIDDFAVSGIGIGR